MTTKKTVVLGMLGTTLDSAGRGAARWERWRPTVSLCQQEDLVVERLELLHSRASTSLAQAVTRDIGQVSPETTVRSNLLELSDAWDLGEVFAALHDFARGYRFEPDKEDYLVHITTGTHIAQICMFLLTESRHFPARLLQTSPPLRDAPGPGRYDIIDLDRAKYDAVAKRFAEEQREGLSFLKSGIETKSPSYNLLVERIEQVAMLSRDPMLLSGPTGSGKSRLARRIFELKKARRQLAGSLVEFNCATLRGDGAMSTLFGHTKGAFTGAIEARAGLLRKADKGALFLDEIGELGLDEQAMLLRAIEEKSFYPVGSDREVHSDFQLIAGTNRDLQLEAAQGRFRDDLLARINLWDFELPSLADRREDIDPNLDYELEQCARVLNRRVTFSREARDRYLDFALSPSARWLGNFRDLAASVRRMATLCEGGRVAITDVDEEIDRLKRAWRRAPNAVATEPPLLPGLLGQERAAELDPFDRVQLEEVVRTCRASSSLSEAGRSLFAASRAHKSSSNDADRLRKYLARFGLSYKDLG